MGASEPKFHLLRTVSGPTGVNQGGRYVIQDPRSVFYLETDKEIQVYFEWQGPAGRHHCEGYWKSADGKSVVFSEFDCNSDSSHFAAYYVLRLNPDTLPGPWSLEAHVDGEVAGVSTFQIVAAGKPLSNSASRTLLSPAEIYRMAVEATVSIEKLRASGVKLGTGSGFILDDGRLVTAFQVINGADRLRVHFANGQTLEVGQVANWNRWQDWAVLSAPGVTATRLRAAKAHDWAVGDRCFFLNSTEGNRAILDLNITGTKNFPSAGERMNISAFANPEAVGSPLFNEYGEVVGIVGGSVVPGADTVVGGGRYFTGTWSFMSVNREAMATPIRLALDAPAHAAASSFADLTQAGQFVPPISDRSSVLQGSVSLNVDRRSGYMPMPRDERFEYSTRDRNAYVFVIWDTKEKRNADATMRIFDLDNHLINQSKPARVKLRPGEPASSLWEIGLASVKAGTYRIDVTLDEQPAWRTFFRVVE